MLWPITQENQNEKASDRVEIQAKSLNYIYEILRLGS